MNQAAAIRALLGVASPTAAADYSFAELLQEAGSSPVGDSAISLSPQSSSRPPSSAAARARRDQIMGRTSPDLVKVSYERKSDGFNSHSKLTEVPLTPNGMRFAGPVVQFPDSDDD
jgi:hypothetical protein